jgi:hypothetical protein
LFYFSYNFESSCSEGVIQKMPVAQAMAEINAAAMSKLKVVNKRGGLPALHEMRWGWDERMSLLYYFGASKLWLPALCLFGLGLFFGIVLRWWAQRTRVYIGTLFKLCHRPRSSDLVWIASFNQCTAQLPITYGRPPPPLTPPHTPTSLHPP